MTEIPSKRVTTQGDTAQGLQCKNCGAGIALGGQLATLPPSFQAKCPTCSQTRTYQKDEIQTLDRVRKQ